MPIILDISGTMYAALHIDLSTGTKPQLAYIRHLVLNSILFINKKFRDEYGELVIAFDHGSWRKRFFPLYKWVRYNSLEQDDHDWEYIHQCMETIVQEVMENFPYPCIRVKYAEGDDVIGVLADKFSKDGEKVMIVSGDKDLVERTKHPLCEQYRPVQRSMYEVEDPRRHEFELIVKGDKDDGVPNIFSPDDFYQKQYLVKQSGAKTPRAAPVSKKFLDSFWEVYSGGDGAAIEKFLADSEAEFNAKESKKAEKNKTVHVNADLKRNFVRNRKLISLNQIPDVMVSAIIDAYNNAQRNPIMKTLTFMQQNNMAILAREFQGFEPRRKNANQLF